jgi:hypothetical protein
MDLPPSGDYGWQRVALQLAHADIPTVLASGLPQWIALFLTAAAFVMIVATALLLRGGPTSSTIGLDALVEQLRQRAGGHAPRAAGPRAGGDATDAGEPAQVAAPARGPAEAPVARSPRRTVAAKAGQPADAAERNPAAEAAPVDDAGPVDDPGPVDDARPVDDPEPVADAAADAGAADVAEPDAGPADVAQPDAGPADVATPGPVHEPAPAQEPEPAATPVLLPVAPPPEETAPVEQRPEPTGAPRLERAPSEPSAKPAARQRSTTSRNGARSKPRPAAAENGPVCQVRWLGKGRGSCFSAVMVDADGVEHSVATSRRVEWRGTAPPDESPESQAALRQLSKILRESGWRPMRGKGRDFNEERWYARRFRQVESATEADEVAS